MLMERLERMLANGKVLTKANAWTSAAVNGSGATAGPLWVTKRVRMTMTEATATMATKTTMPMVRKHAKTIIFPTTSA